MHRTIAARLLTVAALTALTLVPATASSAAPSEQRVRIEGRSGTLVEGPVLTDGHAVRAASDSKARRCDGTNNGAHPAAGPTPTATADDALRLAGMTFDAQWYPGFDDYFLTRFGPDGQDAGSYAYWGILVNGIYTSAGGCQYRLNPGDMTLWVYDAFNNHDLLRLDGPIGIGEPTANVEAGPSTGTVEQVFTVGVNQPLTVTTIKNQSVGDVGAPGARVPAGGVQIAPVSTAANGVQTLSPTPLATTNGAGQAALTWGTSGWQRIKATAAGFVRSNRLDVCVEATPGAGCGPLPADAVTRTAPPSTVPQPPETPKGDTSLVTDPPGGGSGPVVPDVRVGGGTISGLRVTTDGHPAGLTGVRWLTVGDVALKQWRIDYRLLSAPAAKKKAKRKASRRATTRASKTKKGRWRKAATGTTQTSALLDLPAGRTVELRIRFVPTSGATISRALGKVLVPIDDRVRQVRFTGSKKRLRDPRAWRLTVTRMRKKASVRASLAAGRPTLVVRSTKKRATVELQVAGQKPQRLKVAGHRDERTVFVSGRRTSKRTTVRFRVLSGEVRVDGVGSRP